MSSAFMSNVGSQLMDYHGLISSPPSWVSFSQQLHKREESCLSESEGSVWGGGGGRVVGGGDNLQSFSPRPLGKYTISRVLSVPVFYKLQL